MDSSPWGKAAAAQCEGKVPKGKPVCRVIPDGGSSQLLLGKREGREQLSAGIAAALPNGNGSPGQETPASSSSLSSAAAVSVPWVLFSVGEVSWRKSRLGG